MERHDNQFHPESVDEEIDQLLQAHDQAETRAHPRAHFVHEMSDLYLEESRVLDRAWKRLAQHVQPAEQTTSIEEPILLQQYQTRKGNRRMIDQTIPGSNHHKKGNLKRLTTIGSGLVAALLIASVLIAFISYHQSQTTTHTASTTGSGTTPAASYIQSAALTTSIDASKLPTPTATSTFKPGQIFYSTTRIDASNLPTGITSTFKPGQIFYLTLNVQPTPNTSNEAVVINWYGNNKLYYSFATSPNIKPLPPKGGPNIIPTQYTWLAMEMRFDQPLTGRVELYWAKGEKKPLQLEKTLDFTIK
jgi:hypothetical protein